MVGFALVFCVASVAIVTNKQDDTQTDSNSVVLKAEVLEVNALIPNTFGEPVTIRCFVQMDDEPVLHGEKEVQPGETARFNKPAGPLQIYVYDAEGQLIGYDELK